jgi:hypothetical protein
MYFYVVPETDHRFEYPSFTGLEMLIREHYYSNDMKVPAGLGALIENHMCLHLPDGFCVGVTDGEFKRTKTLTFWVVSDNTFRMLSHKGSYANPAEAEKREAVCLSCNNNLMGICSSCSGLKMRFASQMK